MRRMTTTKQLELINFLSRVTKINNMPAEIKVPLAYLNIEEIESTLEDKEDAGEIDFENHVLNGMILCYYRTEEEAEESSDEYVAMGSDEEINFPETITTISKLAE